jgi:hypothetical protein
MSDGVLCIRECPKCGKIESARDPFLPARDADGNPVDGWKLSLECIGCVEFPRVEAIRSALDLGDYFAPNGFVSYSWWLNASPSI